MSDIITSLNKSNVFFQLFMYLASIA